MGKTEALVSPSISPNYENERPKAFAMASRCPGICNVHCIGWSLTVRRFSLIVSITVQLFCIKLVVMYISERNRSRDYVIV